MPRPALSSKTKKTVAFSQQYKCNYCLELLPPNYEVDHVVPLGAGGDNNIDNLQALCPQCHAEKTFTEGMDTQTTPFHQAPSQPPPQPEPPPQNPKECSKCHKIFSSKQSRTKHETKCNGLSKRQCPNCHKWFATPQSKCEHIKNVKCEPPPPPEPAPPPPEPPPPLHPSIDPKDPLVQLIQSMAAQGLLPPLATR